jgi:hypothetical protein
MSKPKNRLPADLALALALFAPVAAHADWHEDCRNIAGFIAVQDEAISHPDDAEAGNYARSFVALVEAMQAESPNESPADIIRDCGFKNAQRIWSLVRSQANTFTSAPRPPPPMPMPMPFSCRSDGMGGMVCM